MPEQINSNKTDLASLREFQKFLFEPIVPILDLLDYRGESFKKILPFWRRNGLLPFLGAGKWSKFSFGQMVWVRILDDLKQINYPLEMLKLICSYFFNDAKEIELWKRNIEFNIEQVYRKGPWRTLSLDDKSLLATLQYSLMNDKLSLEFNVNYLNMLLNASIVSRKAGKIHISFDGQVSEYVGDNYIGHKSIIPIASTPFITLNINKYLEEFIDDKEIGMLLKPQLLNDDEIKVIREMRQKNVKEIVIYNNNQQTRWIESSKTGVLTKKEAEEVRKILGLTNYERITIETIDKESLSFKKTRKKI